MARHSFIRIRKLTDVRGRADYIGNPDRQEHLYATYSTVEPVFWENLAREAQEDFRRSNQKKGECIEARELGIALPESFQDYKADVLLQLFVETFRQKYGLQCTAALHHNKTKSNYHIHMIFADRKFLGEKQVKYATRNRYYDEAGRHVRTKKEVLGSDGKLRPGCSVIAKGEIYESHMFAGRDDYFKSKAFLNEAKEMYTALINQFITEEKDKLKVFDPSGPYLATKKIGKNNPMEAQIRADNALRQEWNRMVDQVLIAGGKEHEIIEFKHDEISSRISESVKVYGEAPNLFADIIRSAIRILKEFLEILMEHEHDEMEVNEKMSVNRLSAGTSFATDDAKEPRPDSTSEEMEFRKMDLLHQQLNKKNRKIYALQKQKETLVKALDTTPKGILHRKERKAYQERIDGLENQIERTRVEIKTILKQHGFSSVREAERLYQEAKRNLEEIHRRQAEWDGIVVPPDDGDNVKKPSVLKQLAQKRVDILDQGKTKSESYRDIGPGR